MSQRKPIDDVLNDKNLDNKRRKQLLEIKSILKFARSRLKLPNNDSYTSYVKLNREAVSWNLIATPAYSMTPLKSCFAVVGCVSYKIFFSKSRAKSEAIKQQNLGHDTHIITSPAYSTGGLFDDPVVSTMLSRNISVTAELIFHELAHQRLFRKNDSAFNEAFASAVGQEGTRLWLKQEHPEKLAGYNDYIKKRWQFFDLLLASSKQLDMFYHSTKNKEQLRKGKKKLFDQLNIKYAQLKKSWGGDKRYDAWFKHPPANNAKLAMIGVYYQLVPEFSKRLKDNHYDFGRFYRYYETQQNREN